MSYPMDSFISGGGLRYKNGIAGEVVTAYQVVYGAGDARWYLADADVGTSVPLMGLTVDPAIIAQKSRILIKGIIQNIAWAWTPGQPIYLSQVAGGMTQTAPILPARTQVVGAAITANIIWFEVEDAGLGGGATGCAILEGSTAYVGFDECKEPYTNYFLVDGAADDVQINLAEAYVTALGGGTVELERGNFVLADPIIPTGNNTWYKGQGADTFINGDGLATTEHAFHVTGRTDIIISDMSIQTQDGGTKTCHCIFIEDGSDRFLIENVVVLDSDTDGIHIEGTDIIGGVIINCEILDADDSGIFVDMDAQNTATFLKIKDNTVSSAGSHGISLTQVQLSEIEGNVVTGGSANGIFLGTCTDNTVVDNTCEGNASSGIILIPSSDNNTLTGNICQANIQHGIRIDDSDNNTIVGNVCNDNDVNDTNSFDGIYITDISLDNLVHSNTCNNNDRYGINIDDPNALRNWVKNNQLRGNGNRAFADAGTDTKLAVASFQFTEPVVGAIVVVSPTGVDVDATTEAALAWGQLPLELQQVVRLKIWAVATDAPINAGGQMHLEVTLNAGASNAAYNTAAKSWNIVNFDGEEADYVADDVVHWVIEDADVGNELRALVAGDSFEIFAIWEVGADPDGATDALFRVVEVEYV